MGDNLVRASRSNGGTGVSVNDRKRAVCRVRSKSSIFKQQGCEVLFISSLPLFSREDQTSEIKVIDYDVTPSDLSFYSRAGGLERVAMENAALSARFE
jgi:hypothetical protein